MVVVRSGSVVFLLAVGLGVSACQLDTMGAGTGGVDATTEAPVADAPVTDGGVDTGQDAWLDAPDDGVPLVDAVDDVLDGPGDGPLDGGPDTVEEDVVQDVSDDFEGDVVEDGPVEGGWDADDSAADAPGDSPSDVGEEFDASPLAGFGLSFDSGPRSFVELGDVPIPSDFTIEAWIRPTKTSGESNIVAKDQSGETRNQFRFGLTHDDYLFFIMSDGAGDEVGLWNGGYQLRSPAKLPMNVWMHVAVVKEASVFRLFVDGVQVDVVNGTSDPVHQGTQSMRIGARQESNGSAHDSFDGEIDEVRLFSTARSQSDIAAGRSAPLTNASVWWSSLVGYWRFDEGAGALTADERGTYPGTLVNDPDWVISGAF